MYRVEVVEVLDLHLEEEDVNRSQAMAPNPHIFKFCSFFSQEFKARSGIERMEKEACRSHVKKLRKGKVDRYLYSS